MAGRAASSLTERHLERQLRLTSRQSALRRGTATEVLAQLRGFFLDQHDAHLSPNARVLGS